MPTNNNSQFKHPSRSKFNYPKFILLLFYSQPLNPHLYPPKQILPMEVVNEQHLITQSNNFVSLMKELEANKKWKIKDQKPYEKAEIEIGDRLVCRGRIQLNLPFQTVFNFLADPAYIKIVAEIVRNFDLLYDKNGLKVVRFVMAPPGPISNREIVGVHVAKIEGNKAFCGNRSCNFPVKKIEDTVLAVAQATGYILQKIDANRTLVTQISYMDIKGSIPNFMKNATAGTPLYGLVKLEEKIKNYNN